MILLLFICFSGFKVVLLHQRNLSNHKIKLKAMTKSDIFKAAHKLAHKFKGNYSACFSLALKEVYSNMKVKDETFELEIPYSDSKARSCAKKMWGAKWNTDSKTWYIFVSVKNREVFNGYLANYIAKSNDNSSNNLNYSEQVLARVYFEN